MKLLRLHTAEGVRPAALDDTGTPRDLSAHVADITAQTIADGLLDQVRGLDLDTLPALDRDARPAPCVGNVGKFMCIGLNYSDHAAESGMDLPQHPILFLKANSAICGATDDIVMPRGSTTTDWEVELGVIVGRTAKYVSAEDALDHVVGYCTVNDVSERTFQSKLSGQWTKGKSCDTFGPMGPWFVTADEVGDPQDLGLTLDVNGKRMQNGSTARMHFSVAEIIAHLSGLMTLHPGDIIATGTPPGVGSGMRPRVFLKPGDLVEAEVAGLGRQRQLVRADD